MCARRRANLAIMLDRNSQAPLHEQIYGGISEAIRTGSLEAGERLPSVRQLAGDLCVSHTIVEQAYLELSIEGYVHAKPRSGYVVEEIGISYFTRQHGASGENPSLPHLATHQAGWPIEERQGAEVPYDFSFMRLRRGSFPLRAWQRACAEVCLGSGDFLERYAYQGQATRLQDEIVRLLHQMRGISCDPRQIMLEPGSSNAVRSLLRLFDPSKDLLGIEEPGWQASRSAGRDLGFESVSLQVGDSSTGFSEELRRWNPSIAFLTPSHQFPTGLVLPLAERVRALEWAVENDAYIVEDDSCFEYRYDMRPIPSLFSLDRDDRTVYLGNFSKVLSPSLRIAYLVLPPQLVERQIAVRPSGLVNTSMFEISALANLMSTGDYDRHVGRMVHANKRVHDHLLTCLTDRFGDRLAITGKHAGMHLYVRVKNGMTTDELIASALAEGAKVYSPEGYWQVKPARLDAVMVGFSALLDEQVEPGVDALARAWL